MSEPGAPAPRDWPGGQPEPVWFNNLELSKHAPKLCAVRRFHHPADDDITRDGILYALAEPTRRGIVAMLNVQGGLNCSQTCQDMPRSTISHHYRILRESGLIQSERRGVEVLNTVRRDVIDTRFPGLLDAIFARPHA